MVLEHITKQNYQIGNLSELEHIIALGDLDGQLRSFLLSCRVDELSPATLSDYEQKLGSFIVYCGQLEIYKPQDVNSSHIRLFILKLQERCNPVSVHDYHGVVKRFFNWLVNEGVLSRNPMASMRSPKVPNKVIQPFGSSHIKDLLTLCNDGTFLGNRNMAIILTFLDTGLRLSELANIQMKDIDFEKEFIQVMGKGAKGRVVGIGKKAQKAILRYLLMRKDNHPCLWVTEERHPMRARGIQIMVKRLGKRAGFKGLRCSPHTFRHTFGTMAIRNGANIFYVQSLLGHSTLTMTRKYASTVDSEEAVKSHSSFSPVDRMSLK